jgi:hypothetical protein
MTDKYKEFKEWFLGLRECDIPRKTKLDHSSMAWANPVYAKTKYDRRRIFEKFEEEQEAKEQEKQTKRILARHISKIVAPCGLLEDSVQVQECYDELKEKGLLK